MSNVISKSAAVQNLLQLLGMHPCEGSDSVKDKATTHTLLLSGIYVGGAKVVCRCRMLLGGEGVTLEVAVRSSDSDVARRIADAVC